MKPSDRIYCALDTVETQKAVDLAKTLNGVVGGIKLGLEFYCANGADGFKAVAETGMPIFLDLKFHDIPNTVAGAIRAVAPLGPKILTIHTQGGPEMMRRASETAAEEAAKHGHAKPWVTGVTILTSLDDSDMKAIGVEDVVADQVARLAALGAENGLDGMVCSPREISLARAATNPDFKLVVPGIRPAGSAAGDQKRVMTPFDAVEAGADVLVIGRPITQADDPRAAAEAIAKSING
ncbi:orotidine-5'-phosphate decarboxylase [Kordiimonas sp. SCSIO 12603]|uniref:orotidine-5'-phosphate decarboxylase n=1 Tax=Kordiimonas sp. SCSIO 12603 TaxID=2829596 RepID=UPI002106E7E9|nr:orotidine-5'-phosphate decarboxylase [Kordiimonas sp. SCSIO 12603]UTW58923.1 orotidine-5'-phosphate decarboxylase [Kordiimonas sp. SCSIO 12603]